MTNRKEKILGIILLSILGLNGIHGFVAASILGPLDAKRKTLSVAKEKVANLEFEYRRITHAQRHLNDSRYLSLPADPAVGIAMYQQWLIEESLLATIHDAKVSIGTPNKIDSAGFQIPVTIQATLTANELGQFLDQIVALPLLHTIRNVAVTGSQNAGNADRHSVSIGLEALCLDNAVERETLISPEVEQFFESNESVLVSQILDEKDLFKPGYQTPIRRPVQKTVAKRSSPVSRQQYRFIAGLTVNGKAEAWLYETTSREQKVIHEGMKIALNGNSFEVNKISQQEIVLACNGTTHSIQIGESFSGLETRTMSQK